MVVPQLFSLKVAASLLTTSHGEPAASNPAPGTVPTRTTETHRESSGKVIDTQSVQRLDADGRYKPLLDTERESVKVDAMTTRNVVRTYGRDPDGRRRLVQVTEETVQGSPERGVEDQPRYFKS